MSGSWNISCLMLLLAGLLSSQFIYAQDNNKLTEARRLTETKKYKEAATLYKEVYNITVNDPSVYQEYLEVLLTSKRYKEALQLVERQQERNPKDPVYQIDLGRVYKGLGKNHQAEVAFENAVASVSGDDMLTTKLVQTFLQYRLETYAIKVYERAIEILRSPFFYSKPLAVLYAKNNEIDKAVHILLSQGNMQRPGVEDIQSQLLEILGNDPNKLKVAQKTLLEKIHEQPGNNWYAEILTWLYTQKGDWDGALMQIRALDERQKEGGKKLLSFAKYAMASDQFPVAIEALDYVLEYGKENPNYAVALAEKLYYNLLTLEDNPFYTANDVAKLETAFASFFEEFPSYHRTPTVQYYAQLKAQFAQKPEEAIVILENTIHHFGGNKDFIGSVKLQLGDYYLLTGKIWDASLTYSQVDKDFREDLLGEEARFKNAKLAYYRGDFEWAQGQLSVLKASTSELMANDALSLSVLITENIPPDSNIIPLQRFADADLLLFQNKTAEAEAVLDSLTKNFPDHPLKDDILMLRASLAERKQDYKQALAFLQTVADKYGDDVLGDDAYFQMARIYEKLNQPEDAYRQYEKLILTYPGSTYVQFARDKVNALKQEIAIP